MEGLQEIIRANDAAAYSERLGHIEARISDLARTIERLEDKLAQTREDVARQEIKLDRLSE